MPRGAVVLIFLTGLWPAADLRAQQVEALPAGERRVAQAESLYAKGAVVDLRLALPTAEADVQEAIAVHRLAILAYLQQDALPAARVTTLRLLQLDPEYRPDEPSDPPEYVALVDELRTLLRSPFSAWSTCARPLARAQTQYREGAFQEALTELAPCVNRRLIHLPEAEYRPALRLLSLLHLRTGDVAAARAAAELLIERVPDYAPDPVRDPPGYVALVHLIRAYADG